MNNEQIFEFGVTNWCYKMHQNAVKCTFSHTQTLRKVSKTV